MKKRDVIHVGFGIDDKYMRPVAAMMLLIQESHPDETFCFWVGVSDAAPFVRWSDELCATLSNGSTVRVVECSDANVESLGVSDRDFAGYISEAMYLRLWLPGIVGQFHVDRLIYLDGDLIPLGSRLRKLWEEPLYDSVIGAVRDAFTKRLVDTGGLPGLDSYDLDPNQMYFNSGVMIIDVKKWLDSEVTENCLSYLARTAPARRFPDQDALNCSLYRKWKRLDKSWNHMRSARLDVFGDCRLDEVEFVHCVGEPKPWYDSFPDGERRRIYKSALDRLARLSSCSA
ncbi:glycosyltransferase family 8 protein [Nesterenkonia suensis]